MFSLTNTTSEGIELESIEGVLALRELALQLAVGDTAWDLAFESDRELAPVSRGQRMIEIPLPPGRAVEVETVRCPWPAELLAEKSAAGGADAVVRGRFMVRLRVPTSRSPVWQTLASVEAALTLPAAEKLAL